MELQPAHFGRFSGSAGEVEVGVDVKNSGARMGDEVVQSEAPRFLSTWNAERHTFLEEPGQVGIMVGHRLLACARK